MSEDRARVLHMVADGKISAEEAADLLDALAPSRPEPRGTVPAEPPLPLAPQVRSRSLVIQIGEGGKNRVNLRIPLGLARAAGRFIPRRAQDFLDRYEIDLRDLVGEGAAGSLPEGPLLEIDDDEAHVRIAVE
ncbi:MAG: hypothetical protein JOZ41_12420 [Chloroflexi bacterium]|nr:hypothetical protein [Chloroflexota bacterium]